MGTENLSSTNIELKIYSVYEATDLIRTDFLQDVNGRVTDSSTCGGDINDPVLGTTQTIPTPQFTVTSTPAGASDFITLD